ncbi:MAG: hypothetical protein IPG50_35895 [Myxococcales bacterium]|nr:hypothetical protein [Myxococcales bacterium]
MMRGILFVSVAALGALLGGCLAEDGGTGDDGATESELSRRKAKDPCTKHPWPMVYGCRDRQGRSTAVGPTAPKLAWQTQLPSSCAPRHLVVDATGRAFVSQDACRDNVFHAGSARVSAVSADGAVKWTVALNGEVHDLAIGGDDALYAYVTSRRPVGAFQSALVHAFVRYDSGDGTNALLFSEEVGTDLSRRLLVQADGRVVFGAPEEVAEANPTAPKAASKVYDPTTKALSAGPPFYTPWLRSEVAGGGWLSAGTRYDGTALKREFWVDRRTTSGGLSWTAADAALLGIGPGGTTFGVLPNSAQGSSGWGRPALLQPGGTKVALAAADSAISPYSLAIGADDSLVLALTQGSAHKVAKYTKAGATVFEVPVSLQGGNVVVDGAGTIYAGGTAFDAQGTRLWTSWSTGSWLPELDLIAPAPNRTLYAAWSRPVGANGKLFALRDAAP